MIIFNGRVLLRKQITGVERYAHELVTRLESRCKLKVAYPDKDSTLHAHLWVQTGLRKFAEDARASAVFCPVMDVPLFLSRKIKIVTTIHDLAFLRHPDLYSWKYNAYYKRVLPLIVSRADAIICISELERNNIAQYFPKAKNKLHVVYHGISSKFRVDMPKKKIILVVAAQNKNKNIVRLLQAFERVMHLIPHQLVLIGSSRSVISTDFLAEKMIGRLSSSGRFLATGYLPEEDLLRQYGESEIFAFPSLFEGFGFPPLEAMSAGCAVVSSGSSVMPEIYGDAAIYFNPNSLDDIANKLVRMATDKKLRDSLIPIGRARAGKFTWDRTVDETLSVIQSTLG